MTRVTTRDGHSVVRINTPRMQMYLLVLKKYYKTGQLSYMIIAYTEQNVIEGGGYCVIEFPSMYNHILGMENPSKTAGSMNNKII